MCKLTGVGSFCHGGIHGSLAILLVTRFMFGAATAPVIPCRRLFILSIEFAHDSAHSDAPV